MEYKRLTKVDKNGRVLFLDCNNNALEFETDVLSPQHKMIKRLAELEDKIENGKLLELPCKVGDTIWEISGDETRVNPIKVSQIYFIVRWLQDGEFGKSLFLTKEKAEQKLKELKGN